MLPCTPLLFAGAYEMRTETAVRATTVNAWMSETAEAVRSQRDYLTQLDAAIGDGDHGTNMDRGFEAAEEGARATVPLLARKGRASYLGERSIGHQDPGATSAALILRALERTVAAEAS